jgi:membrane-bound hydrogenase subunit beta
MSVQTETQGKLEDAFREQGMGVDIPRGGRMFVQIPADRLRDVLEHLNHNLDLTHITAVTAVDVGDDIEILYHFFCQGVTLTLKVAVPKADPVIDTITTILPGAVLYEREIQDLLGVKVKDHPDPRRLVLPEDWEEGVYPLRQDYQIGEE